MMITILRPETRILTVGAPGLSVRGALATGGNWWEASGATAVVAYQAKGAGSYAASLVNLANPGTHDLIEGNAPDWDAATGWRFIPANGDYLTSCNHNLAPYFVVRYAGAAAADRDVVGCRLQPNLVGIRPNFASYSWAANGSISVYDNVYRWNPATTTGVVAMQDKKVWVNGTLKLTFANSMVPVSKAMRIGGTNGDYRVTVFDGYILAYAGYTTITEDQMLAVSAAMAAL